MRTLALASALALIAACGGGGTDKTGDSATSGPSGGTTTGLIGGTPGGTTDPDRNATLNGEVFDCAGAPIADVEIRFCDVINCRYHTTEAGDSTFLFEETLIGWNSLEAVGPAGIATGFVPLLFGDNETRDVSMTLCPLDPATPITGTPTEMELGSGLFVTLSDSAIEPPLFVDPATEAAGVMVDPTNWVPTDEITGTVAAQWFVSPFNHHATGADLPVRFDGANIGLAGATYRAWVGSYDDFAWIDAGTFSDGDADGWYTADGSNGLPLLGTVMLVEE